MSDRIVLEPGTRICLPAGTMARVEAGAADARAVTYENGAARGAGLFLGTVPAGAVAIGLADPIRVELVAATDTIVSVVPLAANIASEACSDVSAWLRTVASSGAWIPFVAPKALFPGRVRLKHGDVVAAPRERVVWIPLGRGWWPLCDGAPLRWDGPAEIEVAPAISSIELIDALSDWTVATSIRLAHLLDARESERLDAMASDGRAARTASRSTRDTIGGMPDVHAAVPGRPMAQRALALAIPSVSLPRPQPREAAERGDARFSSYAALAAIVGALQGQNSVALPDGQREIAAPNADEALAAIREDASEAGLGCRDVKLPPRLTREDGPPVVVALPEHTVPVGAARSIGGRYEVCDADGTRITGAVATGAVALTQPLDAAWLAALDSPRRLMAALVRLSLPDAVSAVLWGFAGVAMGVTVPVATNLLFSAIWPRADWAGHWLVVLGLGIAALTTIAFDSARAALAGRVTMRFLNRLEEGIWLALVRAAPGGLSKYSAGDMQNRIGAAGRIRQAIVGQPMRVIVDASMMLTGMLLMVIYGGRLAWIGVTAVAALALIWSLLLREAVHARTQTERITGRESALLSQAIAAIVKVKATASEPFLLARWALLASQRRRAVRRAERIETAIAVATAGVTGLSTAVVFVVGYSLVASQQAGAGPVATGSITLGAFLAFQAALGQTIAAAGSAAGIFALWPRLSAAGAMLAPVARVSPETTTDARRVTAPPLDGRLEISQVSHRYAGAATDSLRGVDIAIDARQYVGIVGASGSGKSTLLKLILGLEQTSSGAIYFDGMDARRLEPASVRRQIGYVGQDSRLSPGSILENILDGRTAATPEAWAAARLAGIAEDIEAMPMGMHTLVGEAGQNLSGGQRQRLMIARALLTRPRFLIFDEATSALDNRSQAIVQAGLGDLPVTRIVVAHRLSTVMGVDRVFVLDHGRAVESGPPADLLRNNGAFAALARRQQVGDA